MVLETILLMVGAGATMAAGIPLAVRLARVGFSDDEGMDGATRPSRTGGDSAGFAPLDLGPDPMLWPSSTPWPSSKLPVPEWPSKSWNDEHFGRHWQHSHAFREDAPAPPPSSGQEGRQRAQQEQERQRAQQEQQRQRAQHAQQQRAHQQQQQALQQQQRVQQQALQQQQRAQKDAQRNAVEEEARRRDAARRELEQRQARRQQAPQPAAPQPQSQAPGREELLALVDNVGLAGTVQEIMKRTGWDFRKAAQYLARVSAGG